MDRKRELLLNMIFHWHTDGLYLVEGGSVKNSQVTENLSKDSAKEAIVI